VAREGSVLLAGCCAQEERKRTERIKRGEGTEKKEKGRKRNLRFRLS
jgi:hypothetical protein